MKEQYRKFLFRDLLALVGSLKGILTRESKIFWIVSPAIAIIEAALAAKPLITTLIFALFDLSKFPIAIP